MFDATWMDGQRFSELITQLQELEGISLRAPHVRIYVCADDGSVESLEATDLAGYESTLLSVGDTFSAKRSEGFEHFIVSRRIHVNARDRIGWAILVSPVHDPVADAIAERFCFEADTFDAATIEEIDDLRKELNDLRSRDEQEIQGRTLFVDAPSAGQ